MTKRKPNGARRSELLALLRRCKRNRTRGELAERLGVTPQAVAQHLEALRRAGVVTWQTGKHRGVEVVR